MKTKRAKAQPKQQRKTLVVCLRNDGYEASLDIGKVYMVLPDAKAARYGRVRVIDNEGEDYLYPSEYFIPAALSQPVKDALSVA